MQNILDFFAKRHSFYDITQLPSIGDNDINNIIKRSLELYPSAFNSQSARVVVLYANAHKHFWHITADKLKSTTPPEKHAAIKEKISSFGRGHGTILYYTDTTVVKSLEQRFPLYADNFNNWAMQENAILQFMIWTALNNKEIGASLQHYNPIIDQDIALLFDIPQNWKLVAQMPFGGILSTPPSHKVDSLDGKIILKY